jgi:hypothetical protein
MNARLSSLLGEVAQDWALAALRKQYHTNEAALLIRQAGLAEGAEKFVNDITKPPTASQV